MKVTVLRPRELKETELHTWRCFQRENPSLQNPFLSPEFTLAVGRVHDRARVAVIEDGAGTVAFFPYERGPFGIAKAIGAGINDCQGLIHAPRFDCDPQALLAACDLSVWEFDHLLSDQLPFQPYHVVCEQSPVMDLSDGYGMYINGHAGFHRQVRQAMRRLEREVGPLTFEFDVPDQEALQTLILWKSAQYRRTGRFDRFARQWIAAIVRDLLKTRSDECTGTLSMLYASGKPIAAHFGPRSQSVLCSWFPAYDLTFARYKPGLLLFDRMAEAAAAQGIRYLDLGKGQEDYKQMLRSEDIALAEGWVERPSSATLFRRVQRAPRRHVQNFVLSRPALRLAARRALEGFGRVRSLR